MNMGIHLNPWAGLASYKDPATTEHQLQFCGRDDETFDVAKLIAGNTFVTLYGKSGIGKTSLLNAGVFPELREECYTPLSLRLGIRDEENPQSYQAVIMDAVQRAVARIEAVDVIPAQDNVQSPDFLWKFFTGHRFYDKDDNRTVPVIVLDQFEELYRHNREEVEMLLRQMEHCAVNGQSRRYDANVRFVVSIREDDLYHLEDSIDNCYLSALKRCRYRLRSLTEQGAKDVILKPGKGLFRSDEEERIVDTIIDIARSKEDRSISTNVLSLVCNRIFVDFKSRGNDGFITLSLVASFIKGNPFERFYNEATRGFSAREKAYIEEHFVDSSGRRNSIAEADFLRNVNNGNRLLDGENRILQRTSSSSDGKNIRVELIHDSFCEPLERLKIKREKRKRVVWVAALLSIIMFCCGVVYILYLTMQLSEANKKYQVNLSRVLANSANSLVDEGDSYTARLVALQALPPNLPYTIEAEAALRRACQYNKAVLGGHTSDVRSASFSPDGNRIVSASDDNTVRVWDASTGAELLELEGHTDRVRSASFSPDGNRIVSASWDNTVRVWDASTGAELLNLEGHRSSVNSASFSPDGNRIVSASWDNTVRVWDASSGSELLNLEGHTGDVSSASFSPDGNRIVSASDDNTVRVWDASTGAELLKLEGHRIWVTSASFSPDGNRIVSSSIDRTVRVWDAFSGTELLELEGHTSYVSSASFSPDGNRIVSASGDRTVRVWDASTGAELLKLEGNTGNVNSASFSPDGNRIVSASGDNTVRVWYASTGAELHKLEGHWGIVNSASFSPDSNRIVSASGDNTVRVWDASTGAELLKLEGHKISVNSASFSPDGRRIVSASYDKTVRVWDAYTGAELLKLEGHTDVVCSASFSPDANRIVSASYDNTVRVWDASTGAELHKLEGHWSYVSSASFSPDGNRIVSASGDRTVRVWDAYTGVELLKTYGVDSASFSPDGNRIVSASYDNVRVWDAFTGAELLKLEGHKDAVNSASFSPDGNRIVSVSAKDKTVRVWDALTGVELLKLEGHTNLVESASFSPDGNRIVFASSDRTVRVWEFLPIEELIEKTTEHFKNRQLTPEEKRKYYVE